MTTNTLPASNIINVTVTTTPSGLTEKNVNSLAIFTTEAPINGEQYGIYISANQVAANYGTASKTAAVANNIFAQVPNVLSGDGRVVIIPMLAAVSGTHGNFVSTNLSANLASFAAVNNGSLGVTLNGVAQQVSNLNFTGMTTWAQIAAYMQSQCIDCDWTAQANGISVFSRKVGAASTVALTAGLTGTNLDQSTYFAGNSGVSTSGVNSTGETIAACIARTSPLVGYVPILPIIDLEDAAAEAAATAVQALDNLLFLHAATTQDISGIATTVQLAGQTKTRVLTYCQGQTPARLYAAAYAGRACSVDFTGSLTSQTMNLKQLANVVPDNQISETLLQAALVAGTDVYVNFDGVPSVVSTGGNSFFDNPYSDLAAKFALTTAGFNFLRQTNTKVPQTESGMNGLKDAYRQVCNQFVRNGCWAPGAWNSSETFGDPLIFNNNVSAAGFYVYSLPITQQLAADRSARIAPLVQIAAKRAGAIHTGNVLVLVNS